MLVSAIQKNESVVHTHIATFFLRFFSHTGYFRVLSRAPCALFIVGCMRQLQSPNLPYAVLYLAAQSCLTLCDPIDCSPPGSSVHGDSPGKNTGVACHALLQEISQPRDPTQVSCIAGGFVTLWSDEARFITMSLVSTFVFQNSLPVPFL